MPAWTEWMKLVLGVVAPVATLLGALIAWGRRRSPLRLAVAAQPYHFPGSASHLLQLDITNVSARPIVLTGVRMRLSSGAERPVFMEDLGESWVLGKPVAPGETVFVKCSAQNEGTIDHLARVVVYAQGGVVARLSGRAVRRGLQHLRTVRGN